MDSLNREITAFCLRTGADTSQINRTIRIIDCEAVPLYEQLPDELDDAEKVRILRRYFGLKVNAVKQLSCLLYTSCWASRLLSICLARCSLCAIFWFRSLTARSCSLLS